MRSHDPPGKSNRLPGRLALLAGLSGAACQPDFVVEEATIAGIHAAMEEGRLTAEDLVQAYLDRIEAYDKHCLLYTSDAADE